MKNSVHIDFKENPVLLDRVIQSMQKSLLDNIPWLDNAFGKAYKLTQHGQDGNKTIYPAAYNGKGEYISLLPNEDYGNFSWFDIYDPQKVIRVIQSLPQYTISGAIIFWYNLDSIYADNTVLHTEEIKDEIMQVLTTPGIITTNGKLTISDIYERFENIYKGYSIEKIYNNYMYKGEDIQNIDKQFFMYPYAGIRIEFTLTTRELCQRYVL